MSQKKEEFRKQLSESSDIEDKEMSIIKDKHQYSIRIPKDFADTLQNTLGSLEKLKFKFTLTIPPIKSKEKPSLKGELIK